MAVEYIRGVRLARLQEITGDEYPNMNSIRANVHKLSEEERQDIADYEYRTHAFVASIRYNDWHASNAFGGKRSGTGPTQLRKELENARKALESTFGINIKPIRNAVSREYYESRWAAIEAR